MSQVSEMISPRPKSWFAVHTRSRHEKRVVAQLQEKKICSFLPLQGQSHRWSDRNSVVCVPLFPSYAFVQIDSCGEERLAVLRTQGVITFVGNQGAGSPIPAKEIEDIGRIIAGEIPFTLTAHKEGQRVRIRGGVLEGVEGLLVTSDNRHSLAVSIELLRRAVTVRLDGYDVEPVGPN